MIRAVVSMTVLRAENEWRPGKLRVDTSRNSLESGGDPNHPARTATTSDVDIGQLPVEGPHGAQLELLDRTL